MAMNRIANASTGKIKFTAGPAKEIKRALPAGLAHQFIRGTGGGFAPASTSDIS